MIEEKIIGVETPPMEKEKIIEVETHSRERERAFEEGREHQRLLDRISEMEEKFQEMEAQIASLTLFVIEEEEEGEEATHKKRKEGDEGEEKLPPREEELPPKETKNKRNWYE